MLERRTSGDGVVFYVSPLLCEAGVPHGFSTRIGGISPAPFDSLNLGNPNGYELQDSRDRIARNYGTLQRAIGCEDRQRVWLHQVHGARTIRICKASTHDNDTQADALVSDDASRALSVRVADCAPVLLSSRDGRMVAAVHAGWRGVVAEVVVAALRQMALPADQIIAAIGPCIGYEALEVGPEVVAEFSRAMGAEAPMRTRSDGKGHLDIREALRRQLLAFGVTPDRIDTTNRCTHRDRDEFFSHRRDCGITGRMAALIAPRR